MIFFKHTLREVPSSTDIKSLVKTENDACRPSVKFVSIIFMLFVHFVQNKAKPNPQKVIPVAKK